MKKGTRVVAIVEYNCGYECTWPKSKLTEQCVLCVRDLCEPDPRIDLKNAIIVSTEERE